MLGTSERTIIDALYLATKTFLVLGLVALVVSIAISILISITIEGKSETWLHTVKRGYGLFVLAFVFGFLGITIGYLSGLSRVGVMGAVLPSTLTFIGGIGLYLLSWKESSKTYVTLFIGSFAVCLLLGTMVGANFRRAIEYNDLNNRFDRLMDVDFQTRIASHEEAIARMRLGYDLPPEPIDPYIVQVDQNPFLQAPERTSERMDNSAP